MCDNIIDLRMACDLNGLDIDIYIAKENQGDPIPVYAHVGGYLLGVIDTHQKILPQVLDDFEDDGGIAVDGMKLWCDIWLRQAIAKMIISAKLDCAERFYTREQHEKSIDNEIELGFRDMLRGLK